MGFCSELDEIFIKDPKIFPEMLVSSEKTITQKELMAKYNIR